MTISQTPEVSVATTIRHRAMITPFQTYWLLWCNCGLEEEHQKFDAAMNQRWRHLGVEKIS